MSPKRPRFLIQFEPEQLTMLKELSANTMAPVAAIVRKAVDEYLARQPKTKK